MSRSILMIRGAAYRGEIVDLFVSDDHILELKPGASDCPPSGLKVIDAQGLILLPGLIDPHAHFREPGFEHKETIATGLAAAAHGGFGTVLVMANTNPVNDNREVTELMLSRAAAAWPIGPRLHPIGALTVGLRGQSLANLEELAQAGCRAFSNDGLPVQNARMFRQGMEKAAELGLPLIDHCEDRDIADNGHMNDGRLSRRLGIAGQPALAESLQVARDVCLARYLNLPVHLAHISCRQSVEIIAWAKSLNAPVTAETCPHYLLFTEDDVEKTGTLAKVNPPLRTMDDLTAVRQALADGTIDMLSTDHAPHAGEEKARPFDQAPFGISGLDTALSLTWKLVQQDLLDLKTLERVWHGAASKLLGLVENRFQPGDPAEFILFDPRASWTVTAKSMYSKSKNTPCLGLELPGRVRANFVAGRNVLE